MELLQRVANEVYKTQDPLLEEVMNTFGELTFFNPNTPNEVTVECSVLSVPKIMAWYGAMYAGDLYFVEFNGCDLPVNKQDGTLEWDTGELFFWAVAGGE